MAIPQTKASHLTQSTVPSQE